MGSEALIVAADGMTGRPGSRVASVSRLLAGARWTIGVAGAGDACS